MKPVLFVTNLVPPDRAGAFRALHAQVPLELALFGGRSHHATAGVEDPGVPHRHVAQRERPRAGGVGRLRGRRLRHRRARRAARGAGRRRAAPRVPFVLWSALWGHLSTRRAPRWRARCSAPRIAARRPSSPTARTSPPTPARSAPGEVVLAPQAVDNAFWSARTGVVRRRPLQRPVGRARGAGEGPRRAAGGLVAARRCAAGAAGCGWSARRRARTGPRRPRAAAQLLRPQPRCRRTVDRLTPLPRAVGPRRQRGHEPALRHHRHRRRRRRRGRARARRRQRARSCPAGDPARWPGA